MSSENSTEDKECDQMSQRQEAVQGLVEAKERFLESIEQFSTRGKVGPERLNGCRVCQLLDSHQQRRKENEQASGCKGAPIFSRDP